MSPQCPSLRFPVLPANPSLTRYRDSHGKMVIWDFCALLEYAEGDIANVFGSRYKIIDTYRRRVRLPCREYLLVSRVTKLENATTGIFKAGATMTTEYDLPVNGALSEGGDTPLAVFVESGQCDLMLVSYLGIDFQVSSSSTLFSHHRILYRFFFLL